MMAKDERPNRSLHWSPPLKIGMAVPLQRISSGSWTPSSRSSTIYIGRMPSLRDIWNSGWNSWLAIWLNRAFRGIGMLYRLTPIHTFSRQKTHCWPLFIDRTENAFQTWLKKGVTFNSTDYVLPAELCAMVNVVLDAKQQSFKLCAVDGVDVVNFRRSKISNRSI